MLKTVRVHDTDESFVEYTSVRRVWSSQVRPWAWATLIVFVAVIAAAVVLQVMMLPFL